MSCTGKVAVVTGGASGIGFGLAEAFAAEGMKIVLADIEAAALAEAAEKLRAGGADVLDVVTDVSVEDQVIDLATNTYTHFGTAHIVCNNAGVGGGGGLMWEIPQSGWDWTFGVNFWGVLHGIRAFVPRLVEQERATSINTASIAGLKALPFMSPYTATKHAVVGISEALAFELAMTGSPVKVSVLCPGFIRTRLDGVRSQLAGDARRAAERSRTRRSARWCAGSSTAARIRRTSRSGSSTRCETERFFILSDDEHAGVPEARRRRGRGPAPNPTSPDVSAL